MFDSFDGNSGFDSKHVIAGFDSNNVFSVISVISAVTCNDVIVSNPVDNVGTLARVS